MIAEHSSLAEFLWIKKRLSVKKHLSLSVIDMGDHDNFCTPSLLLDNIMCPNKNFKNWNFMNYKSIISSLLFLVSSIASADQTSTELKDNKTAQKELQTEQQEQILSPETENGDHAGYELGEPHSDASDSSGSNE